jgi:hypothetical protein
LSKAREGELAAALRSVLAPIVMSNEARMPNLC